MSPGADHAGDGAASSSVPVFETLLTVVGSRIRVAVAHSALVRGGAALTLHLHDAPLTVSLTRAETADLTEALRAVVGGGDALAIARAALEHYANASDLELDAGLVARDALAQLDAAEGHAGG